MAVYSGRKWRAKRYPRGKSFSITRTLHRSRMLVHFAMLTILMLLSWPFTALTIPLYPNFNTAASIEQRSVV